MCSNHIVACVAESLVKRFLHASRNPHATLTSGPMELGEVLTSISGSASTTCRASRRRKGSFVDGRKRSIVYEKPSSSPKLPMGGPD